MSHCSGGGRDGADSFEERAVCSCSFGMEGYAAVASRGASSANCLSRIAWNLRREERLRSCSRYAVELPVWKSSSEREGNAAAASNGSLSKVCRHCSSLSRRRGARRDRSSTAVAGGLIGGAKPLLALLPAWPSLLAPLPAWPSRLPGTPRCPGGFLRGSVGGGRSLWTYVALLGRVRYARG